MLTSMEALSTAAGWGDGWEAAHPVSQQRGVLPGLTTETEAVVSDNKLSLDLSVFLWKNKDTVPHQ